MQVDVSMVVKDVIRQVVDSLDEILAEKTENEEIIVEEEEEKEEMEEDPEEALIYPSKFTRPLHAGIPPIELSVGYKVSLHLPGDTDEESDHVIEGIVENVDIKRKLLFVDTDDGLEEFPYNAPGLSFFNASEPELIGEDEEDNSGNDDRMQIKEQKQVGKDEVDKGMRPQFEAAIGWRVAIDEFHGVVVDIDITEEGERMLKIQLDDAHEHLHDEDDIPQDVDIPFQEETLQFLEMAQQVSQQPSVEIDTSMSLNVSTTHEDDGNDVDV